MYDCPKMDSLVAVLLHISFKSTPSLPSSRNAWLKLTTSFRVLTSHTLFIRHWSRVLIGAPDRNYLVTTCFRYPFGFGNKRVILVYDAFILLLSVTLDLLLYVDRMKLYFCNQPIHESAHGRAISVNGERMAITQCGISELKGGSL
jgi:hypothetical protein